MKGVHAALIGGGALAVSVIAIIGFGMFDSGKQQYKQETIEFCNQSNLCDGALTLDMQLELIDKYYDLAVRECGNDSECVDEFMLGALTVEYPEAVGSLVGSLTVGIIGGMLQGMTGEMQEDLYVDQDWPMPEEYFTESKNEPQPKEEPVESLTPETKQGSDLSTPEEPEVPDCDPSYPDFCIPPNIPDLDCGEIDQRNFRVLQPDPHRFDGDKDGMGCESKTEKDELSKQSKKEE